MPKTFRCTFRSADQRDPETRQTSASPNPISMERCPSRDELESLLADALPGSAVDDVRAHVRDCTACQELLEALSDDPELRGWREYTGTSYAAGTELGLNSLIADIQAGASDTWVYNSETEPGLSFGHYSFLGPPRRRGDLGTLGEFPVQAELGRGGMGIVLLAFDEALDRSVALKILRPELADASAQERFVREARAAARVKHDHVVSIYGVSGSGTKVAYCVMEYLAGPSLAERIRTEGRLAPREAASVAAQVADGLAAAHAAGLVHRDIKPSNILFDPATGRAKITDFGLARFSEAASFLTQEGAISGTPAYMSPEQARGADRIGPLSDIYSLGATLYETLTGEPPFRGDVHRVLNQVLYNDPRSPREFSTAVSRDLETICLKCLAKEPHRRYANASALAVDLRHYLDGEPIVARPVRPWVRWARWAKRRPVQAALGAFSAAALTTLIVGSIIYSINLHAANRRAETNFENALKANRQAEANFKNALQAINQMLTRLGGEELSQVPEMEQVRRELLDDALKMLHDIMATPDRAEDPAVRRELAGVHSRLGSLYNQLGDPDRAIDEYREALVLVERLQQSDDSDELASESAGIHDHLGLLLDAIYRRKEAAVEFAAARKILEPLVARDPERNGQLAALYNHIANQSEADDKLDEAESYQLRGLELHGQSLASDRPLTAPSANILHNLAVFFLRNNRVAEAEKAFHRCFVYWEPRAQNRRESRVDQVNLAEVCNALGMLYSGTGRAAEAEKTLTRALTLRKQLAEQFPNSPEYADNFAKAHYTLANFLSGQRRSKEAIASMRRSIEIREELVRKYPRVKGFGTLLAQTYLALAVAVQQTPAQAEVLPTYDNALKTIELLRAEYPNDPDVLYTKANVLLNIGVYLEESGRARESLPTLDEAVSLAESLEGPAPQQARVRDVLFKVHGARYRAYDKLNMPGKTIDDLERMSALADPPNSMSLRFIICIARAKAGQYERAAADAEPLIGQVMASDDFYNLGCLYSLAARGVEADAKLSADRRSQLLERYASKAVALLRRARDTFFFLNPGAYNALEEDHDLDAIRPRPEFQRFVRDLTFPADPFVGPGPEAQ